MPEADLPKAMLGLGHLAVSNALKEQLIERAKSHNNSGGAWLDEIESKVILDVKKCSTSGLSEDDEFKAMRGAIALVQAIFLDVRHTLESNSR